jgi:23S rRNA pseudouridine1911/1915/1917 synthase
MNSRAKQRAQSGIGAPEPEPALRVKAKTDHPTLTAASQRESFVVGDADAGERLDRFLGKAASERKIALSRTRLKALIEAGAVRLDDAYVTDPAHHVAAGSRIEVEAPAAEPSEIAGENIPLSIVFEDAHLLVLDKPAGLVVHPAPGHSGGTLVNALIAHCGETLSGIGGVKRPGIVHRLDKDTSGLLVVAKTDAAHRGLSDLFADHGREGSLRREYLALAWGAPERRSGTVEAPLGRHPRHREKMAVVAEERGRAAVTHWKLVEALGPASLIACRLETGRTHQIRVHMAHIGHPLLGDQIYGGGFRSKAAQLDETARAALAALDRQALHAALLGFTHPITGEALLFESPPPADLMNLIRALRAAKG